MSEIVIFLSECRYLADLWHWTIWGPLLKDEKFKNQASSCSKLAQMTPRAKFSWRWDIWWLVKYAQTEAGRYPAVQRHAHSIPLIHAPTGSHPTRSEAGDQKENIRFSFKDTLKELHFKVRRTGSLCPSFSGNRLYVVVCQCFPHRFTSLSLNRLSYSFVTCWVGMGARLHWKISDRREDRTWCFVFIVRRTTDWAIVPPLKQVSWW